MNKLSLYEQVFNAIKSKKKVKVIKVCNFTFIVTTRKIQGGYAHDLKDVTSRLVNMKYCHRAIDLAYVGMGNSDFESDARIKRYVNCFFHAIYSRVVSNIIYYTSEFNQPLNIEQCRDKDGCLLGWKKIY